MSDLSVTTKSTNPESTDTQMKMKKWIGNILMQIWFPAVLISIWQLVASLQIYPAFMLPGPIAVVQRGWEVLTSGFLFDQIAISLKRQFTGFIMGISGALLLGFMLGISLKMRTWMMSTLKLLYPIPGIAWVPLAILWFGIGDGSIIFIIFMASIWPLLFNTISGIDAINPTLIRASKALGATKFTLFFRVYLPGALPYVITGLRLSYGASWRNIVGAEIVAAASGLGYMINNARSLLAGDEIIVGMITIGILGFVIEKYVFDFLQKVTIKRWGLSNPDA
ncbi:MULTISPECIES: ABC transporter permease [unclassified Paenibacillus]|uniref:ABC transporter permease n=1 Tax=unclassified Paenibacillus TaxID=185978 RepID=UPI001AE14401|nr:MULTISPECIES: ABC transporter permease [unclassified Paenibacillus]MBP1154485.1 ABC-type nitrate/sulfonate/bicarbonate transport system permease component [Paenibacillus sp. PvP091]MBP1170131.1 ABC-type nitrate/sulfonate/bicarbonate transport system permease component [Paenibacillus sp. PvR098]MBP2441159.1 ABC-type nitrate/sulfonate/bicarbonate transport system permease component [Paenibacillus sp. PvP052]